jgi:hypothetical protein
MVFKASDSDRIPGDTRTPFGAQFTCGCWQRTRSSPQLDQLCGIRCIILCNEHAEKLAGKDGQSEPAESGANSTKNAETIRDRRHADPKPPSSGGVDSHGFGGQRGDRFEDA